MLRACSVKGSMIPAPRRLALGLAMVAAFATTTASLGAAGTSDTGRVGEGRGARGEAGARVVARPSALPGIDRAEESLLEGHDTLAAEPWRTHFGHTDVYIPTFFQPISGKYDLIVHFHGLSAAQESNVERARVNAVVVSINVGVGSGPYESAFKEPWSFNNLVNVIDRAVARSGRARGAKVGRIALSAWSAGYGSVSAILRVPGNVKRIDALLLADGLHSDYTNERRHIVDDAPLAKYARIAQAAIQGEKLFALTHSSITTTGYPNTTETIGELLKLVNVAKSATVADGPRGMLEVYESHSGDLHVKGFLGTTVKDHIDHIWGMNETMLPYLRDRWSR